MKNIFSRMSLFSIVLVMFIFNFGFTKPISAQTCQNPPLLPLYTSFPQNSVVNVYIEPSFNQSQRTSIRLELNLWSNQGLANVSFNEVFDVGDLGNGAANILTISHWWVGLSALPVETTDAIVIGTVTNKAAYLADDKTNIYSEYEIKIEKILKDLSESLKSNDV